MGSEIRLSSSTTVRSGMKPCLFVCLLKKLTASPPRLEGSIAHRCSIRRHAPPQAANYNYLKYTTGRHRKATITVRSWQRRRLHTSSKGDTYTVGTVWEKISTNYNCKFSERKGSIRMRETQGRKIRSIYRILSTPVDEASQVVEERYE